MQLLHSHHVEFPPPETASPEGILAIGGNLLPETLIEAYRQGIFPWYNRGEPIVWWHPPRRMVLFPEEFKISKSLQAEIRKNKFKITVNQAFTQVMEACAQIKRKGQKGTWIQAEMIEAYTQLHRLGFAVSIEAWYENRLAGGLYGMDLKGVFCGESMFAAMPNASKVAFAFWVEELRKKEYKLIDCQVYTDHLAQFGAREIDRADFLKCLGTKPNLNSPNN